MKLIRDYIQIMNLHTISLELTIIIKHLESIKIDYDINNHRIIERKINKLFREYIKKDITDDIIFNLLTYARLTINDSSFDKCLIYLESCHNYIHSITFGDKLLVGRLLNSNSSSNEIGELYKLPYDINNIISNYIYTPLLCKKQINFENI